MGINAQQILGQDPEQLRRQLAMQQMQQLNPQGTAAGAIGALLGGGLSNVAQGRGFFQAPDQGLQRVSDVQRIMRSFELDPENPRQYYLDVAKALQNQGYGDLAPLAVAEAAKLETKKESPFAKIDPSKFTSDSLREYQKTGDVGDLDSIEKNVSLKPSTDFLQIGQELGIPAKGSIADYSAPEAARINAEIKRRKEDIQRAGVPLEDVYGKGVTQAAVKRDQDIFEKAQKARDEITKLDQTLDLIESGNIVTGFGADIRLGVERFVAQFAADPAAKAKVTNTQVLEALLGSDVFPLIGALGIGARGLDTIPERQFLQKVFTGEISLTQDTLLRLTEIRRNITQRVIDRYNERVNKGQLDRFFRYSGEEKATIDIPRRSPAGIRKMSDEELLRLRQQGGSRQ